MQRSRHGKRARVASTSLAARFGAIAGGVAIVVFSLFPIYWVVKVAFTSDSETFQSSGVFTLSNLTIQNFATLSDKLPIWHYFLNSLIVAVATTVLSLLVAAPAAYSFTRFVFPGRKALSMFILLLYMLPPIVLVVPLLILYGKLGISDTLFGLVLANSAVGVPFATWLLMGSFAGIPRDLEESALVDGCGHVGAMTRIALPLAVPGLVAAGAIVYIFAWNDFLFAFTLTSSDSVKTLQVALRSFVGGEGGFYWGTVMASVAVTSFPVIALFLIFQRGLVGGLTEGGVKG